MRFKFLKNLQKQRLVQKNDYFCVEKYALTEKNEQLFNDIQPIWVLRESSDFCKLCRG